MTYTLLMLMTCRNEVHFAILSFFVLPLFLLFCDLLWHSKTRRTLLTRVHILHQIAQSGFIVCFSFVALATDLRW